MSFINKIILVLILIISLSVGMFQTLANPNVYLILHILTVGLVVSHMIIKFIKRDLKFNIFWLLIIVFMILGVYYRDEKVPLYAISFVFTLFSYYAIDIKDNALKYISIVVSIAIIPTIIFNGMFNSSIQSGMAFSGRLNPMMYFPYVLITMSYYKNNKIISFLLKVESILIFTDLLWAKTRTALLGMLFILIGYIIFNKRNKKNINYKTKKILKILLLTLLILQIIIPQVYIFLYKNYAIELNTITYKWTKKDFFSGRQRVWSRLDDSLIGNEKWGTGDVDYKKQIMTSHNEFMNCYYCWGIFVAVLVYIYLYSIGRRAIEKMENEIDLIIILGFMSTIICTMFETYSYVIHFYIFNNILLGYLLNKNKKEVSIDEGISKCYNTNIQ